MVGRGSPPRYSGKDKGAMATAYSGVIECKLGNINISAEQVCESVCGKCVVWYKQEY